MRQRQLQNFLIRDKSIVWLQKRDGVTIATVQIRSIWLKLYFKEKQETKFVIMGLSPSGCMFSFSPYFIRHNFRIVFCFIFFWTCGNALGSDAVPGSLGAPQPLHLLTVWGGSKGKLDTPGTPTPLLWGLEWPEPGVPGPSSVGNAGLWQIWWALTDPAPLNEELCGAGKGPTEISPAGSVAAGAEGKESWECLVGAASGLWGLLWFLLVETKLRRGVHCI